MRSWNYSARWFKKNQEVTLTKDILVWDIKPFPKWFGKDSTEHKAFKKGTKAQILDYLGRGYQLQVGEDIINYVPEFCLEVRNE